jgi:hypothetical protein
MAKRLRDFRQYPWNEDNRACMAFEENNGSHNDVVQDQSRGRRVQVTFWRRVEEVGSGSQVPAHTWDLLNKSVAYFIGIEIGKIQIHTV